MKKIFNIAKNLAFLALGVFLFWLVYRHEDFSEVEKQLAKINYYYVALAIGISIFSHWLRGARWSLLIRPLGHKVSHFNAFVAVMVGYFANVAVPRLGEISRCVVLNRSDKIGLDKLIGTVILERLVDMVSLLLILALTLALQFNKIGGFFTAFYHRTVQGGATGKHWGIVALLVTVGLLLFFAVLLMALYRRFKNHSLVKKVVGMIAGFKAGFMTIGKLDNLWLFVLQSVSIWGCYYLVGYVMFSAIPFTAGLGPLVALAVFCMGSFGFVVPVPGGVGAFHFITTQALMLYGLSQQDGSTFALVAHTVNQGTIVIVGFICFMYFSLAFKKNKPDATNIEPNTAQTV